MTAVATKFTPLGDRILVRPAQAEEEKGGLFIPDQAREQPMEGEVLAVGSAVNEGCSTAGLRVPHGARVIYGKYAGTEIVIDGETLLVLKLADVLGVLG